MITYEEFITGDKFKIKYENKYKNILFSKIDNVLSHSNSNYEIVITHNGDLPVTDTLINSFKNIKFWFGQNILTDNKKAISLPIGLENEYIHNSDLKKNIILKYNKENIKPNRLVYCNFNIDNNIKERKNVELFFKQKKWCTNIAHNSISLEQYYSDIVDHKFVICPIGGGLDCHRNWEVLYCNRFPIMKKKYYLEKLYSDLPVLFVDDWHEVTDDLLYQKYEIMKNIKYNYKKLFISYWFDLIEKYVK